MTKQKMLSKADDVNRTGAMLKDWEAYMELTRFSDDIAPIVDAIRKLHIEHCKEVGVEWKSPKF